MAIIASFWSSRAHLNHKKTSANNKKIGGRFEEAKRVGENPLQKLAAPLKIFQPNWILIGVYAFIWEESPNYTRFPEQNAWLSADMPAGNKKITSLSWNSIMENLLQRSARGRDFPKLLLNWIFGKIYLVQSTGKLVWTSKLCFRTNT